MTDYLYGKPLSILAQGILDAIRLTPPGEKISVRGVEITRALWGPWIYVQRGEDGYRSECDQISGAVHAANLVKIGDV